MTPANSGCPPVHAGPRVLILKPSSLGDVIQALPVLRLIKRHKPASEVYWWLNESLAPLLEGDPDLSGLYLFSRRGWSSTRRWRELVRQVIDLRRMRFDWVIDLQGLARSAGIAWLANGKWTVGVDDAREGAPGFYDLAVPRGDYATHAVDWYLKVLTALGVPITSDYEWLPERPAVAESLRKKWDAEGTWIGLQPGARWLNKRWPVESYAELVKLVHRDRPGLRFVVLGGNDECELGRVVAAAVPGSVLDLTGRTTLPEMIEWVRRCAVLVTNDTGPMHVAAAIGLPVVALFGPTEPRRTGPYGQLGGVIRRTDLACVPCMSDRCRYAVPNDCLRGVGVESVAARVKTCLGTVGTGKVRPPK